MERTKDRSHDRRMDHSVKEKQEELEKGKLPQIPDSPRKYLILR